MTDRRKTYTARIVKRKSEPVEARVIDACDNCGIERRVTVRSDGRAMCAHCAAALTVVEKAVAFGTKHALSWVLRKIGAG